MIDARADRAGWLADCLERARAGDRTGLEEIVRELNPLLWHVVRAQGLDREASADVVQTVWLHFVRQLDAIHTTRAVAAWLVTAARREAWAVVRRERARPQPDSEGVDATASPAPEPDERLITDERDRALWRAVRRLSERCRRLLRVVAIVDRPDYDRLSADLGMPRGSIGPTRGRCLARLRDALLADPAWSR